MSGISTIASEGAVSNFVTMSQLDDFRQSITTEVFKALRQQNNANPLSSLPWDVAKWPQYAKDFFVKYPTGVKIGTVAIPLLTSMHSGVLETVSLKALNFTYPILDRMMNFFWNRQALMEASEKFCLRRQEPNQMFIDDQRWIDLKPPSTGLIPDLYAWISPRKELPEEAPKKCFFPPQVARQIQGLQRDLALHRSHGRSLRNAFFFGPPGTGKTRVCNEIVKHSEANYVVLSSSKFQKAVKLGIAPFELERLFGKMARSKYPTVLFIDECDELFKSCDLRDDPDANGTLKKFLTLTQEFSGKCMVLLASNYYENTDKALKDRVPLIYIGLPAYEQRYEMLQEFVSEVFPEEEDRALFSETRLKELAKATEGFSGRKIDLFVKDINRKRMPDEPLKDSMIDEALGEFLVVHAREQEAEETRKTALARAFAQMCQPAAAAP